jgi:hypothetical protein
MRFAYTRPDGGVNIVNAAPKERLELVLGALTDDEYRAHVVERSIPADALDLHELPEDWAPPDVDRTFRDAWRKNGVAFSVDMAHARDIHRNKMRRARAPLLEGLDVEAMRALEQGKPTTDIVIRKQALRDVTADPAIEAAQTPEKLKAVWPAFLLATAAEPARKVRSPLRP